MSKFDGRTKGSALKQLDESLQRLEVDHLDLWDFTRTFGWRIRIVFFRMAVRVKQ
jgi:hypothetical protein